MARIRERSSAHAAAHALNYGWKFMRACYGWRDAYEKQCAGESLSGITGRYKSQLSHFEKRKDLRRALDVVRYFRYLFSFSFTASDCERNMKFCFAWRGKREKDAYCTFNKNIECYCCLRFKLILLFYRLFCEIYQNGCRDQSEIFYTRVLHPKCLLTGTKEWLQDYVVKYTWRTFDKARCALYICTYI